MFTRFVCILILQLCPFVAGAAGSGDATREDDAMGEASSSLPLYFIENQGQIDSEDVAYYVKGADRTLYFTSRGITIVFFGGEDDAVERFTVRLDFEGALADVAPRGADRAEAVFSYFKGRPDEWRTGLPAFARLVYTNLWPGIDLVFSGSGSRLKYEFIVQPGADPALVRLSYAGIDDLFVSETGELVVTTAVNTFEDGKPFAYQTVDGGMREVSMEYALGDRCGSGGCSYGFRLGDFDPALPLHLDPAFSVYCGYIGGSGDDAGWSIAVDGEGSTYVAGTTGSDETTFPVVTGPDATYNGSFDAFIAKINADGTALEYCGYIGGTGDEEGWGVTVNAQGNAFLVGTTESDETTFPVIIGPDLTFNGGTDAFAAKLSVDGTSLRYCGYIGGIGEESGQGIALDPGGNAYLAGYTGSDETTFPVRVGPDLTFNGNRDAFVARVKWDGSGLDCCGYIGGAQDDLCYSIAVDSVGHAYATGSTLSDEATFPVRVGPDLSFNDLSGGFDAFLAKVELDGSDLVYCGYVGGSKYDECPGIAVDDQGHAYLAGFTASDETTFPVIGGPDLTHNGGTQSYYDAFVAKVELDGSGLVYCGYIGGKTDEIAGVIAVDGEGNAYIAGSTQSGETGFPVQVGPDLSYNGKLDGFVTRVDAQGEGLDYCGYIGGIDDDFCHGIAVDDVGNVFLSGWTRSDETTFPVHQGPDVTFNGTGSGVWGGDAFVVKVPQHHILLRAGNVDVVNGDPADILLVNGTAGDDVYRKVVIPAGSTVTIAMRLPPSGPNPASFALYAWFGEAGELDPSFQPYDIGTACFPMPLGNGLPWAPPTTVANNTGYYLLGFPLLPGILPAPTYVVQNYTLQPGAVWTLQGIIFDNGSGGGAMSLTNAVVLIQE